MKKSKSLKKLSLKKLTISKLANSNLIQGGSAGICDTVNNPKSNWPYLCPPNRTCHKTGCDSCDAASDQINGC